MPGYSGSITYKLTGNLTLNSFPFLKRETGDSTSNQFKYTVTTLNEALGGGIGPGNNSSSLLQSVIGQGKSATFITGSGFVGSLRDINPDKSYWLKPVSSSFNTTVTIDGLIRNTTKDYALNFGWNMISYPFDENKVFGRAFDTSSENSIQNRGIKSFIGAGVAHTFDSSLGWVGSLDNFTTGSGYWARNFNTGQRATTPLWESRTEPSSSGGEPVIEEWVECTDRGYDSLGAYGRGCTHFNHASNGFTEIPEAPFSASGHTFGHWQSQNQFFMFWPKIIGYGPDGSLSSSLFSSTGTPITGSRDGSSDYIVAFYAESGSSDFPHPTTCGTIAWHDNQFGDNDNSGLYYGTSSDAAIRESYRFAVACLMGDDGGFTQQFGYPTTGQKLKIKVYDPTRDIVVSAKSHKVNINNGTASIGDTFDITWRGNNVIEGFITGSAVGGATQMIDGLLSGVSGPASGGACIKLDA